LNDVGWYASALFLTVAAAQSVWGKAFKYFSVKMVYLFSIAIFEVGSLICGKFDRMTAPWTHSNFEQDLHRIAPLSLWDELLQVWALLVPLEDPTSLSASQHHRNIDLR